jgi:hypothetical protein
MPKQPLDRLVLSLCLRNTAAAAAAAAAVWHTKCTGLEYVRLHFSPLQVTMTWQLGLVCILGGFVQGVLHIGDCGTDWMVQGSEPSRAKIFFSSKVFRPAVGPTKPRTEMVLGSIPGSEAVGGCS